MSDFSIVVVVSLERARCTHIVTVVDGLYTDPYSLGLIAFQNFQEA